MHRRTASTPSTTDSCRKFPSDRTGIIVTRSPLISVVSRKGPGEYRFGVALSLAEAAAVKPLPLKPPSI